MENNWEQIVADLLMDYPAVRIVLERLGSDHSVPFLISYSPRSLEDRFGWWMRHPDDPLREIRCTTLQDLVGRYSGGYSNIKQATGWST